MVKTTLYAGNCLSVMQDIPDSSIDMVLCDLPYGTTQNKWDSVIPFKPLWEQYKRICSGAIVLTAQSPFDKLLGASNIEMFKYEWIWQKTRVTGHLNAKMRPLKSHENVMVFYIKPPTYNPQGVTRKSEPKVRKGGNNGTNYGKSNKTTTLEFENYPRSILQITSVGRNLHPTQKPVALMEYLIRTYTNEGDTVLDNCMGSGTTGVACVNTNRNFVGIELDATYFELARGRIELRRQVHG